MGDDGTVNGLNGSAHLVVSSVAISETVPETPVREPPATPLEHDALFETPRQAPPAPTPLATPAPTPQAKPAPTPPAEQAFAGETAGQSAVYDNGIYWKLLGVDCKESSV